MDESYPAENFQKRRRSSWNRTLDWLLLPGKTASGGELELLLALALLVGMLPGTAQAGEAPPGTITINGGGVKCIGGTVAIRGGVVLATGTVGIGSVGDSGGTVGISGEDTIVVANGNSSSAYDIGYRVNLTVEGGATLALMGNGVFNKPAAPSDINYTNCVTYENGIRTVYPGGGGTPDTYAVTYAAPGASGTVPAGGEYEAGASVPVAGGSGLTNGGLAFFGWVSSYDTNIIRSGAFTMPGEAVTLTAMWQTSAPVASVDTGEYSGPQAVSLTAASGAAIYYTTDDSDPRTSGTRQVYASGEPLTLSSTTTLKAYAAAPGYVDSEVMTKTYSIDATAQYHPVDVAVINGIIDNNGLTWTKDDPGSWNC